MIYLAAGFLSFGLFFLYDINSFTWENRGLHGLFLIGNIILLVASGCCVVTALIQTPVPVWRMLVFGVLAGLQAFLLVYTLYFALPFGKTYTQTGEKPCVYKDGVYSLCRHPGVLWFFFLYLFLAAMTGQRLMSAVCFLYSGLNVLYVCFQDRVTFMRTLEGYGLYREETPFLIPNKNSILRCIGWLKAGKVKNEVRRKTKGT